eukprot:6036469-Amphidinium_carterae.1
MPSFAQVFTLFGTITYDTTWICVLDQLKRVNVSPSLGLSFSSKQTFSHDNSPMRERASALGPIRFSGLPHHVPKGHWRLPIFGLNIEAELDGGGGFVLLPTLLGDDAIKIPKTTPRVRTTPRITSTSQIPSVLVRTWCIFVVASFCEVVGEFGASGVCPRELKGFDQLVTVHPSLL